MKFVTHGTLPPVCGSQPGWHPHGGHSCTGRGCCCRHNSYLQRLFALNIRHYSPDLSSDGSNRGRTYTGDQRISTNWMGNHIPGLHRDLKEPSRNNHHRSASSPTQEPIRNRVSKPSHNKGHMSSGRSDSMPIPMDHLIPMYYHIRSLPSDRGYRMGESRHPRLVPRHCHIAGRIPTARMVRGCHKTPGKKPIHPGHVLFALYR